MPEYVQFRVSEDGADWASVPVLVTIEVGTMYFEEANEFCDRFALFLCRASNKMVRWNREVPNGLGQGHYTDPFFALR